MALGLLVASLSGCVGTDEVLFVTKTSLGLDFDAKPPNASIAYDRIEGYIGPRYENGAVPPVVASIRTDAKLFNPQVKQVYATGAAAVNLVTQGVETEPPTDLSGAKKLMLFGTTTTTGLKVGFTGNTPDSFLFGFRRKEFSLIPLGTRRVAAGAGSSKVVDVYPSVLASVDTGAKVGEPKDTELLAHQFFATGEAASELGKDPAIQALMKEQAKDAFAAYREAVSAQQEEALQTLGCFVKVRDKDLLSVWQNAEQLGLFYTADKFDKLKSRYQAALQETDEDKRDKRLHDLRSRYADDIRIVDGGTPTRTALLRGHRNFVCDKAKGASAASNRRGG